MKLKSLINILKTIIVLAWAGAGILIGLAIEHETLLDKVTLTAALAVVLALFAVAAILSVETLADYILDVRMRRNIKHMELDTPTEEDDVITRSYEDYDVLYVDECIVDCDTLFEDDKESADCETLCKQTELDFENKGTRLWLLRASYKQLFNYILNNRFKDTVIDTKGMSKKDVVKLINKVAKLKTKSFVGSDAVVDIINNTIDGLIRSMQMNRESNQ